MTLPALFGQIFSQGKTLLPDGELHILILGEDGAQEVFPEDSPAAIKSDLQELASQPLQLKTKSKGEQSIVAVPIMADDALIGVIRYASGKPHSADHQMIVQMLADQIAASGIGDGDGL